MARQKESLNVRYLIKSQSALVSDREFIRTTQNHHTVNEKRAVCVSSVGRAENERWFDEIYCADQNLRLFVAIDRALSLQIGYINFVVNVRDRNVFAEYIVHPNFNVVEYLPKFIKWSIEYLRTPKTILFDAEGGTSHKLWLTTLRKNKIEIEIYKAHGFKNEGTMMQHVQKFGEFLDVVNLGLILNK